MPCYVPDSLVSAPDGLGSASPHSPEGHPCPPADIEPRMIVAVLGDIQGLARVASGTDGVITPCLRFAAAFRSHLMETRPEVWRAFEIYYRQHVRQHLCPGDLRHWDAALRLAD
jgi:hypothetical protein